MKITPAASVNGVGAMGAIEPVSRAYRLVEADRRADQFVDANNMVPFPENWPRTRRPTAEEWAGIEARQRALSQEKIVSP